jgi:hypothetical protein
VRTGSAAAVVPVLSLTLVVATACGSAAPTSSTSSSSAPTPTPSATSKPLGTTITTASGTYTVLAFQPVQPKSQANTPNPGGAFFAADVKECSRSGQPLAADPTQWLAVFSGNEQADGRDASRVATPGAPLATATVNPGQCVEGWVAFTGFADGIPREVHLTGVNSWWSVP